MYTEMTDLALKWYPQLTDIIHKHRLKIKLDSFGVGRCIFYKDEEIGYFVEWIEGINLHLVPEYGVSKHAYSNWGEVVEKLEEVICYKL